MRGRKTVQSPGRWRAAGESRENRPDNFIVKADPDQIQPIPLIRSKSPQIAHLRPIRGRPTD